MADPPTKIPPRSYLPRFKVRPFFNSQAELSLQPSSKERRRPSITGMWFVNFFSSGAVWDHGFDIWHSDGTEILNDNGYPPAAGNVCLGVWRQTSHNTYKLKHPA